MKASRFVFIALVLGGLLVAPTGNALAQETGFSVEGHGGVALPIDHQLYEAGATFGGALTYWVTDRFGFRASGDLDMLSGKSASDVTGPVDVSDMDLSHFRGGFAFRALDPGASPWQVDLSVLGGVSHVSVSDLPTSFDMPAFEDSDFSETYFGASAGAQLGYRFSEYVGGFLGTGINYVATDREDFMAFSQFDPSNPEAETFTQIWTLPVRAGVKVHF